MAQSYEHVELLNRGKLGAQAAAVTEHTAGTLRMAVCLRIDNRKVHWQQADAIMMLFVSTKDISYLTKSRILTTG